MLKTILTVGIPASGKSTWAKEQVANNPSIVRINRDDLRNMMFNYVYSDINEKLVKSIRENILISSLKMNRDVIIDDCNISSKNFTEVCNLIKSSSIECIVTEQPFFISLNEAISRNSFRSGSAYIPEGVIRSMWKKSGGENHKNYVPRTVIINKCNDIYPPLVQDGNLPKAVVFDNDGTISTIHSGRNPYDASTCDLDIPNDHVIEALKLYYNSGYKVLFVSGREEKDREPTERFYKKHFPEIKYSLFMRNTNDKRKDVIIKEEIYNNYIKNTYNVCAWFDDRLQVCQWIYKTGLPLFRVGNPDSNF